MSAYYFKKSLLMLYGGSWQHKKPREEYISYFPIEDNFREERFVWGLRTGGIRVHHHAGESMTGGRHGGRNTASSHLIPQAAGRKRLSQERNTIFEASKTYFL